MRYLLVFIYFISFSHIVYPESYNNFDLKTSQGWPYLVTEVLDKVSHVAKNNTKFNEKLLKYKKSITVVFVPGILGSCIKNTDNDKYIWCGEFDVEELKLDSSLIDENNSEPTNYEYTIFEKLNSIDIYGEALEKLRNVSDEYDINLILCPYDWRRDIRASAKRLEKVCLNKIKDNDTNEPTPFIIIAHSMGGVVTWAWHQKYYNNYSYEYKNKRRLINVVALGAPLLGSCEVIRMIEKGYVSPAENWLKNPKNYFDRFKIKSKKFTGSLINAFTGYFTQELRPVIFTWPGAFGLTPRHHTSLRKDHCLPVKKLIVDGNDEIHSYYEKSLWTTDVGKSLRSYKGGQFALPAQYEQVLNKSKNFREWFEPKELAVPTSIYYSEYWHTPNRYNVTPDNKLSTIKENYTTTAGDGRVSFSSALGDISDSYLYRQIVGSGHGELPKDEEFYSDYYHRRLPQIINSYMLLYATKLISNSDELLNQYKEIEGTYISWLSIEEQIKGKQNILPENIQILSDIENINNFNKLMLFGKIELEEEDINKASEAINFLKSSVGYDYESNKTYQALLNLKELIKFRSKESEIQDRAQEGLSFARLLAWESAINPLQYANDHIPELNYYDTSEKLRKLHYIVKRNLGFAYYQTGRCFDAFELYKETGDNKIWEKHLKKPCINLESKEHIYF